MVKVRVADTGIGVWISKTNFNRSVKSMVVRARQAAPAGL